MNPIDMFLFLSLFSVIMAVVVSVLKKARGGSEKYQNLLARFRQEVNAMLEPGETVEADCGYNPCAAVTNKRLLIGTKKGIESVRFGEIRKLKGMNASGVGTTIPDRMLVFEIKAAKKYVLGNHSEGFDRVVELLYRYAHQ